MNRGSFWDQIKTEPLDYGEGDDGLIEVSTLAHLNAVCWDVLWWAELTQIEESICSVVFWHTRL